MNFVDEGALRDAATQHRLKLKMGAGGGDTLTKYNLFLYRVVKSVLDMALVVAGQRTIQPEHLHNVSKISAILSMPVGGDAGAARSMVGGTVLPAAYFGETGFPHPLTPSGGSAVTRAGQSADPVFGAYGGGGAVARAGQSADPVFGAYGGGGAVARAGQLADPVFGAYGGSPLPMKYFDGGSPLPMKYFDGGSPLPMKYFDGGSPYTIGLTERALVHIVREYRARSGHADLRMSEAARSMLRVIVETNVSMALTLLAKKNKTLTGASLGKLSATWKVLL
jgi:hypothetical protein